MKKLYLIINNNKAWVSAALIVVAMNIFSYRTLTTKPAVWYDEGINIELSRNFSEFGKLDLIIEPLTFSGRGAASGSTGYPVTLPLALTFKLFGFGLEQARLYMLAWMSALVFCLFYFVKKHWDGYTALLATLLITTFASFYGNGRSVMGEIPGFTFLILTLLWYFYKKNLPVTGLWLGLAVVSKPAVYIWLVPAFVILFLFEKKDFFVRIFKLGGGALIPFVAWIIIYFRTALSADLWSEIGTHFSNPYTQDNLSPLLNVKNNLLGFFHSPTLVYFSLLLLAIVLAIYFDREYYKKNRQIFILSGFYSLAAFLYYLKNVSIFHYIIGAQFLIFIFFVPSTKVIIQRFFSAKYVRPVATICFVVLVGFQITYLLTRAKLFYSDSPEQTLAYIEKKYGGQTVGLINIPPVAALISADKKIQTISTYGLRNLGTNPLSLEEQGLPGVVIMEATYEPEDKYQAVLESRYKLDTVIGGDFAIYQKVQ